MQWIQKSIFNIQQNGNSKAYADYQGKLVFGRVQKLKSVFLKTLHIYIHASWLWHLTLHTSRQTIKKPAKISCLVGIFRAVFVSIFPCTHAITSSMSCTYNAAARCCIAVLVTATGWFTWLLQMSCWEWHIIIASNKQNIYILHSTHKIIVHNELPILYMFSPTKDLLAVSQATTSIKIFNKFFWYFKLYLYKLLFMKHAYKLCNRMKKRQKYRKFKVSPRSQSTLISSKIEK